ncbi:MAG: IclR family transcriptional regulator [Luteolibacter sp.]
MTQDKAVSSSLIKALDVISFLSGHAEGLQLLELVDGSALPRSTVIRILQTLEDYGLVTKLGRHYLLTTRFRAWANPDRYSLLRMAYRPILEAISAEVKELVLIGLREGAAIIHIDYIDWDNSIPIAPIPHTRHPWDKHALGKLAMSLTSGILEKTRNAKLRAELEEIQRTSVAWNREESQSGMIAMATWALLQAPSEPMISVAWPTNRFTEEKANAALRIIRREVAKYIAQGRHI